MSFLSRCSRLKLNKLLNISNRFYSSEGACIDVKKGLLLGCYEGSDPNDIRLSETASRLDDSFDGRLSELVKSSDIRKGKCLVFNNLGSEYHAVAVAGLGPEDAGFNEAENLDETRENVRVATGVGAQKLQEVGVNVVQVEGFGDTEAAAEGAVLGLWHYDELKNAQGQSTPVSIELLDNNDREAWQRGIYRAEAQNLARRLSECPANLMTPSILAANVIELLCPCGVQVKVRERDWIETKKMTAFLSMARGSCEPPLFLELGYYGSSQDERPIIMVGKGVTFDSGGLCLKKAENMMENRGDMAGAAVIIGVLKAISQMNLPINVNALIPLCENMPGGMAMKPGDVVLGMNGKTIRIENTDNDGRVIMADALTYSQHLRPKMIIDIATLTHGIRRALGSSCSGAFTTSDRIWYELSRAGAQTGDRVWRFPLWKYFTDKVTDYAGVDVNNVGKGLGGDPCLGAAFLMEFVPPDVDFCHIDITGTGLAACGVGYPYLRKGYMTGRPTRTIIQFLYQLACSRSDVD